MATTKPESVSDFSCVGSIANDIRNDINSTITRLKAIIEEEASLRKTLHALFLKRKEEAIERVRIANLHLDLVNQEEASFIENLKRATAAAQYVGFRSIYSIYVLNMLIFAI